MRSLLTALLLYVGIAAACDVTIPYGTKIQDFWATFGTMSAGEVACLEAGTYTDANDNNGPISNNANEGLTLRGAGIDVTVLDCSGPRFIGQSGFPDTFFTLENLTLTNCGATSNSDPNDGVMIGLTAGAAFNNVKFDNSGIETLDKGGAIFVDDATVYPLTVTNCVFVNVSGDDGGAIWSQGTFVMKNSVFEGCTSTKAIVYVSDNNLPSTLSAADCVFSNNNVGEIGALYMDASNADTVISITNSDFFNNTGTQRGGGFRILSTNSGTAIELSKLLCVGNTAEDGGCAYIRTERDFNVTDLVASSNVATNSGGGVYFFPTSSNGAMAVYNSVFTANTGETAGGLFAKQDLRLYDCEFDGNVATSDAAAVYINADGGIADVFTNIVVRNHATAPFYFRTTVSIKYSYICDNSNPVFDGTGIGYDVIDIVNGPSYADTACCPSSLNPSIPFDSDFNCVVPGAPPPPPPPTSSSSSTSSSTSATSSSYSAGTTSATSSDTTTMSESENDLGEVTGKGGNNEANPPPSGLPLGGLIAVVVVCALCCIAVVGAAGYATVGKRSNGESGASDSKHAARQTSNNKHVSGVAMDSLPGERAASGTGSEYGSVVSTDNVVTTVVPVFESQQRFSTGPADSALADDSEEATNVIPSLASGSSNVALHTMSSAGGHRGGSAAYGTVDGSAVPGGQTTRIIPPSNNKHASLSGASALDSRVGVSAAAITNAAPVVEGLGPASVIGQGGQATVYEALSYELGSRVVLKVFHDGEAFAREADILAAAGEHANVVATHNLPSLPPATMCLEFASHGSLADYIDSAGGLVSVADVAAIALGVANGLVHLHGRGVCHLDIKPDNILIKPGSLGGVVPVITDFGASFVVGRGDLRVDQCTVRYSAPEVVKLYSRQSANTAAADKIVSYFGLDVFSFGAMVWESDVGERPHIGLTPEEMIAAVCDGDGLELDTSRMRLDRLASVVALCLQDAKSRPTTLADVVGVLGEIAAEHSAGL